MNKSLTMGTRLHGLIPHSFMIAKEIIQNVANVHEVYRALRHWVEGSNDQVIVVFRHMANHNTAHKRMSIDHLTLNTTG